MDYEDDNTGYQIMHDTKILYYLLFIYYYYNFIPDNEDETTFGASEGFTCYLLAIALRWFATQADSDLMIAFKYLSLKKIRDLAARKLVGLLWQTEIGDFLSASN